MSRRIAAHFGSMAAIRAADADTLAGVDGIGTEKARVVAAELVELAPLLDKLQAQQVGTQVTEPQKPATDTGEGEATADGPLAGQAVVVTGSMTGPLAVLSRNEMNELIERAGGKASSSVSKRTTLLVAGEKAAPSAPRPRNWASASSTRRSSPSSSPTSSPPLVRGGPPPRVNPPAG